MPVFKSKSDGSPLRRKVCCKAFSMSKAALQYQQVSADVGFLQVLRLKLISCVSPTKNWSFENTCKHVTLQYSLQWAAEILTLKSHTSLLPSSNLKCFRLFLVLWNQSAFFSKKGSRQLLQAASESSSYCLMYIIVYYFCSSIIITAKPVLLH